MALFSSDGPVEQRWPYLAVVTLFSSDGPV